MTERLPESHLLPDAVVAFVDAELSLGAQERAAAHLARCPSCAAEVSAQRQARSAVRDADAPAMSAGFLASLRSIPEETELPVGPDNLAVTGDGQFVAVQRPERLTGPRGGGADQADPVHDDAAAGPSGQVEQTRLVSVAAQTPLWRRRTAQGAGVVVSGIVLSALTLVVTAGFEDELRDGPDVAPSPDVLRVQFRMSPSSVPSSSPMTGPTSTRSSAPPPTSVASSPSPAGQR